MAQPYDYWVPLSILDINKDEAVFYNQQTQVTLAIPAKHWVKMGRPGSVRFSPTPDSFIVLDLEKTDE